MIRVTKDRAKRLLWKYEGVKLLIWLVDWRENKREKVEAQPAAQLQGYSFAKVNER